jgi:hypothetical protein
MTNVRIGKDVFAGRTILANPSELLSERLSLTVTFVAATTGAVATHKIADVTGVVAVSVFAVCGTNLAGATAKIEVGTALTTAGLIAQTTATDIDANEIWHDASPDKSVELTSVLTKSIVTQDINYKITTAAISSGAVTFYILWSPISPGAKVELA